SAISGNALTLLAVLYGLAAAGWQRIRRPGDALYYSLVAGISAVASLALVSLYGFRLEGDPYGATWIYGLYAAGALAVCVVPWPSATAGQGGAPRIREAAGYVGAVLLALALIQGI